MADGRILLARSFPHSKSSTSEFGIGIGRPGLQQQYQRYHHRSGGFYRGGVRVRKVDHHHLHYQYRHNQEQQQQRRLGGGNKRRSSLLGLCRVMASAAGGDSSSSSSASAPNSYRGFQSYSEPTENWRAKKQGGGNNHNHHHHKHQSTPDNGGDNGEIPHVNGASSTNNNSNVLHQMPQELAEDFEAKAARLESSALTVRPKRIILVRHGESEGNVDEGTYTRIPDSKISLTDEGWRQAIQCGKRIREIIERDQVDDWKVYFYVSPYRRTLQTLRGIGLAFERERIAGVREEPRIREQDFGNFQDRDKMRVEKEVRLRYGRFFYRFPNGESAADVYDRITGFRETLRADVDVGRFQRPESRSKNMNLVMVSHGLTLRVFLMRWYKWTVEQFEGLWNFGNTGMMVMELGPGGRYSLSMHHSTADLKAFGMTDDMIADQDWQKYAQPGDLNYDWLTSGSSFFTHFDDLHNGSNCDEIPSDIMQSVLELGSEVKPEPPTVE